MFPDSDWQRCVVHFYRNVFAHVPHGKVRAVAAMKAIHAREERAAARRKAGEAVVRLRAMKLGAAAMA